MEISMEDDLNLQETVTETEIPGTELEPQSEADKAAAAALGAASTPEATPETDEQKNARVADEARQKAEARARSRQASINQRFAEITAEKKAAEKMAQELLEIVKKGSGPSPTASESDEPKRESFETFEEYLVAKTAHTSRQEAKQMFEQNAQEQDRKRQAEQQAATERDVTAAYVRRTTEIAKTLPDYQEVMDGADVPVPKAVGAMIMRMDNGPLVAYHLQKNPALAGRFANEPAYMHGIILGEISAGLKAAAATPSSAPTPGKPTSSSKTVVNADNPPEDTDAYFAWAKKHLK